MIQKLPHLARRRASESPNPRILTIQTLRCLLIETCIIIEHEGHIWASLRASGEHANENRTLMSLVSCERTLTQILLHFEEPPTSAQLRRVVS